MIGTLEIFQLPIGRDVPGERFRRDVVDAGAEKLAADIDQDNVLEQEKSRERRGSRELQR